MRASSWTLLPVAALLSIASAATLAAADEPQPRYLTVDDWYPGQTYFEKPPAGAPEAGTFIYSGTGLTFQLWGALPTSGTASAKDMSCCNISPNMACSKENKCCGKCDVTVSDTGSGVANFKPAAQSGDPGSTDPNDPSAGMDPALIAIAIAVPIVIILCAIPLIVRYKARRRREEQSKRQEWAPATRFAPAVLHDKHRSVSPSSSAGLSRASTQIYPAVVEPVLPEPALLRGTSDDYQPYPVSNYASSRKSGGPVPSPFDVDVEMLPEPLTPYGGSNHLDYHVSPPNVHPLRAGYSADEGRL